MVNSLSQDSKLRLYDLILARYRDKINENETLSVSQIKQKISPEDDHVVSLRQRFIAELGLSEYKFEKHFFMLAQRTILHMQKISNLSLPFTFWLGFSEMEQIGAGQPLNKGVLLVSLLRSFDCPDARLLVTKKGRVFARFAWKGETHYISVESGSLINGEEIWNIFSDDGPSYSLNDLEYENHED